MPAPSAKQTISIWVLTIFITLASVVFQRVTGPTYPLRGSAEIDGKKIKYKLPRSHFSSADAEIRIKIPDEEMAGELTWRRLKSNDSWRADSLAREGDYLVGYIPKQPAAGKAAYDITLVSGKGTRFKLSDGPVVIRFKGDTPKILLWPHIITMFMAMLLGTRSGLEALYKGKNAYRFALWTSILFFIGGFIFGPIVQKYAFGSFWTGWPFGTDLTDSKTAVAMIAWLAALWRGRDINKGRKWFVIAAAIQLLVYLIPHSLLGSELDYTKMNR
jgi:hypothetical protein